MTDDTFNQPSEHERRVAEEEHEREGAEAESPMGSDMPPSGDPPRSTYEEEVDAEHEGTSASERKDRGDDSDAPVDSAYKPRTG